MAIDKPIVEPISRPDSPFKLPSYGAASTMPGVRPAAPAPRSGASSFSALGAAKPVATGVNRTPAPIARPQPPAEPLSAHSLGQDARRALGTTARVGAGLAAGATDALTMPMRRAGNLAANFGRGLIGAEEAAFNPTPVQDALASVAPSVYGISRPTPPARQKPSFAGVQTTTNLGAGVLPRVPAAATPTPQAPLPRPGDLNTFTGANGVTRRISAEPTAAAGATPAMGAVDTAPLSAAAHTAQGTTGPAIPIPTAPPALMSGSQNVSRSGEVHDMRQAALSEIGSQLFQLRGQNTRSSRAAIGDLLQAQSGLVNNAATVDAQLAGGNRDAAVTAGSVGAAQAGENARAALNAGTTLQGRVLQEAGNNERVRDALARPTFETAADGSYLAVTADGTAREVSMPDGSTVRLSTLSPRDRLNYLASENKDILDQLATIGLDAETSAYLHERLSENQAMAGTLLSRPTQRQIARNPTTGERRQYNAATGEWEAIK